jgi:predicted RNA polymerase sigma factor
MTQNATRAIEEAFTEEWWRIVAAVIRRTRDWDLAEDCAAAPRPDAPRADAGGSALIDDVYLMFNEGYAASTGESCSPGPCLLGSSGSGLVPPA